MKHPIAAAAAGALLAALGLSNNAAQAAPCSTTPVSFSV